MMHWQTPAEYLLRDRVVTAIAKESIVGWVAAVEIAVVVNRNPHQVDEIESPETFQFFQRGLKENEIGIVSLW